MKKGNLKQQRIALLETPLAKKWLKDERTHLVTNHKATVLPYYISIIPLKPVNHTLGTNLWPNTLLEIEENPFLSIEQLNITIIPVLQKIGLRIPHLFMAVLRNPGSHNISLK